MFADQSSLTHPPPPSAMSIGIWGPAAVFKIDCFGQDHARIRASGALSESAQAAGWAANKDPIFAGVFTLFRTAPPPPSVIWAE